MTSIWNYPTRIRFGAGELARVPEELQRLAVLRPLIVTDPGVVRAGLTGKLEAVLTAAGIEFLVFSGVAENPTEANIEAGADAFRAHLADCVIGLGGGSPLDSAKLIAVRARVDHPFDRRTLNLYDHYQVALRQVGAKDCPAIKGVIINRDRI